MYTSESNLFSKEFESKAIAAIQKVRPLLTEHNFLAKIKNPREAGEVIAHGHRWKNDKECYQAMIMELSKRMRKARGIKLITKQDAEAFEKEFLNEKWSGLALQCLAMAGILDAIDCDHWYMFEKQWE